MTEIRDLHDRSLMTETHSDKEIVICFEGEKKQRLGAATKSQRLLVLL
jgi:hypothetical protein